MIKATILFLNCFVFAYAAVGGGPANGFPTLLARASFQKFQRGVKPGQFAVLYLHPANENDELVFLNAEVNQFMSGNAGGQFQHPLGQKGVPMVYPQDPAQSNFAMAGFGGWETGGRGHSEQRLLAHLNGMLTYTRGQRNGECPAYVVLYSVQAPCFWPAEKKGKKLGKAESGCTVEIARRFQYVRRECPQIQLVLGYRFGDNTNWLKGRTYLEGALRPALTITQTSTSAVEDA